MCLVEGRHRVVSVDVVLFSGGGLTCTMPYVPLIDMCTYISQHWYSIHPL